MEVGGSHTWSSEKASFFCEELLFMGGETSFLLLIPNTVFSSNPVPMSQSKFDFSEHMRTESHTALIYFGNIL